MAKFLVEDKVKIMDSEIVGVVVTVGFYDVKMTVVKYWVEYVSKEGVVKGSWFEEHQLSK